MSLVCWIPLIGNVNQQGLSSITMHGSPNSWVDGKLGKCAHFAGSTANVIYNNTTDFNFTDNFSYCCWLKQNFTSGAQYAFTVGRADAGGYGYGIAIASATQITTIFGTRRVAVACAANEWHHVTVTVGDGKVKSYVDGSLVNTSDVATVPTYSDGNGLGIGCFHYSGNIYPYYGDLQDFRIYDHCLSALEVKQISQALLLHYPMTGGGRGAENIAKNTGTPVSETSTYNIQNYNTSEEISSGVVYTATIKGTIGADKYFGAWMGGGYTGLGSFTSKGNGIFTLTFTGPSSVAGNQSRTGINIYAVPQNNTNKSSITWFKLEKGSKPTPWMPNSADTAYTTMGYNNNTEYDVSGNNYHATITGTVERNSNTARYSTCTGFNSSTYESVSITPGDLASRFTFAWWARNSYEGMFWGFANGNRLNLYMASGVYYWNTGDGSNNPFGISSSTYRDGNWHHYAVTGDGTTVKLYIDGEFKANAKTFKGVTGTSLVLNGWDSSSSYDFNGYLSDFRLYATCLSATQVSELYTIAKTIHN
jgi:hypothetical protein